MKQIILDFETTSLDTDIADIVEVGIIDAVSKSPIFASRVKPAKPLSDKSKSFLGLDDSDLEVAISQRTMLKLIKDILNHSSELIIYNAAYDYNLLIALYGRVLGEDWSHANVTCAMEIYRQYLGVEKWVKLPNTSGMDGHSAIADCISTANLLTKIGYLKEDDTLIKLDF